MNSRNFRPFVALGLLLSVAFLASGCRTRNAFDTALEERARWTVLATDWTQTSDNVVLLSTSLSGPLKTPLRQLTVKVVLQDAAGETVQVAWHSYDLTEVPRGGPKAFTLRIEAAEPIAGLGVDKVLGPTADEIEQIPELNDLE